MRVMQYCTLLAKSLLLGVNEEYTAVAQQLVWTLQRTKAAQQRAVLQ